MIGQTQAHMATMGLTSSKPFELSAREQKEIALLLSEEEVNHSLWFSCFAGKSLTVIYLFCR